MDKHKNSSNLYKFDAPVISENKDSWNPSQAVGGGPVLVKDGTIHVSFREEGFGEAIFSGIPELQSDIKTRIHYF